MPLIPETTNLGPVKPNVAAINREVILAAERANPGRKVTRVWGYNAASVPEHSAGTALDFMVYSDKVLGDWIANYLWDNRVRLGLRWEIWQQRIRSTSAGKPTTWTAMADRGSVTQNHMDHIHANFWEKAYVPPANAPQEDDMPTIDEILNHPIGRQGLGEGNWGTTSLAAVAAFSDGQFAGIRDMIASLTGTVSGLATAVQALAADKDLDIEEVKAAANAGAAQAIADGVRVVGTLNVEPDSPQN